jgi:phosphoenolpyruvate-protein kinase (PTS system EI component)
MESRSFPTKEEIYDKLAHSLQPVGNREVTIRLLDIGGDKRLPYFEMGDEISPFLGMRGIRVLLKNPELLLTQLRALIQLHKRFNIRILIPMVTLVDEVISVREMLDDCYEEDQTPFNRRTLQIGTMIETPASVISIRELMKISDFVSVGTNDLTQYMMAASRESPEVAEYYDKGSNHIHSAVIVIAEAAKQHGKECCICGEMANDKFHLELFIKSGIRHFSVSPYLIPELKKHVKKIDS